MKKKLGRPAMMKVSDVAKMFQVSDYTVRTWLKDGKLKGNKPAEGHWRIHPTDVAAFANEMYGDGNE